MVSERASKLHFSSIIVDTHSDSLARPVRYGENIGVRTESGHMDLPRMREGNQTAQFFACFPSPKFIEERKCIQVTLDYIDAFHTLCVNYPDQIEQATTAEDVRRISDSGKLAGILAIEGGHAIDDDLAVLRMYYRLGVRYMTLTWNNTNNWADGVLDEPRHDGLTDFGRDVVREMNRLGMFVDISHVAPKTFWDAIETTTKPVIASHSSAKTICQAPRNMDDDQLRALAENGGVVGVNYEVTFVSERYRRESDALNERKESEMKEAEELHAKEPEKLEKAKEEIEAKFKELRSTELKLPDYTEIVDHIDHMVKVAGVEHVGIGSDFDGCVTPEGMEDCTKVPKITEELVRRGYSDGDIRKILGENFLRVMDEVLVG